MVSGALPASLVLQFQELKERFHKSSILLRQISHKHNHACPSGSPRGALRLFMSNTIEASK